MINWFQNTFSTAPEQATLFSILVSTTLAVFLLLLNQWFTNRKSKREFKIIKIEELYKALYVYERLSLDVLSMLYDSVSPNEPKIMNKLSETIELAQNIELLANLYFPNIGIDMDRSQKVISSVHKQFDTLEMGNTPDKDQYIGYSDSSNFISTNLSVLKAEMKKTMKKFT